MSLFSTDTALTQPGGDARWGEAQPGDPAEALAKLLPMLVAHALSHGNARTAAITLESASSLLPDTHPAMQSSLSLIDSCSELDAAMVQRHIAGDVVVMSSQTASAPGKPRFHFGASRTELMHPAVLALLNAELVEAGAQPELRNFMEVAFLPGDHYLDLEPGAGAAVLTAISLFAGRVIVVTTDELLHTLIARNASQQYTIPASTEHSAKPEFTESLEAACTRAFSNASQRTLVHLGNLPVAAIAQQLRARRGQPFAIAWNASDAALAGLIQHEFEEFGASSFTIGEDAEGLALQRFRPDCGATTAFALNESFIESLDEH